MKTPVATTKAPAAIGPYAQGNIIGNLLVASGQIPVDPETGIIAEGIEAQATQALKNVKAVVEAAGSSMDKVIKTPVFLKDMNDFAAMNAIYATFFPEGQYPSRSAVEVARLPKDALVEIEVIASK